MSFIYQIRSVAQSCPTLAFIYKELLKMNEEKMKNSSLKKFNAQEHIIYK